MARPKKDAPQIDWQAIYDDWLTGKSSNAQLARKYGLAPSTVNQHIQRNRWSMTSGPIAKPVVTERVEPETVDEPMDKPGKSKTPTVAQMLKKSKDIVNRLISEVENVTTYQDEIRDLIFVSEEDPLKRRAALKAISVTERTRTMKDLVTTLRMIEPGKPGRPRKEANEDEADEPKGKKATRQAEAEKAAASGVFAVPQPPKLVVNR